MYASGLPLSAQEPLMRRIAARAREVRVCVECGRIFDLTIESAAAEWSTGHDCE